MREYPSLILRKVFIIRKLKKTFAAMDISKEKIHYFSSP